MVELSEYITTRQASERYSLAPASIRQLLIDGRLPGVKMGRDWLLTPASVEAYLAGRRKPGLKQGQKITRPRKIAAA
jgi:excisionase family DNA binding protein